MVVKGYWDNPGATAESFVAGYWCPGDLGSIDADGFVRVFDRKKDMINRGGYIVYSVEVENALMGYPGVVEVTAVAQPSPVLGERVHVLVVSSDPQL
ncbi:MAG: AMP-binding protein [Hyphomonadaceae bacterium]|nr:AMP-binding protein [Hyphomonadaceae bacterium]